MDVESKLKLLKRNTQEIVTEDELRKLLKTKRQLFGFWQYFFYPEP